MSQIGKKEIIIPRKIFVNIIYNKIYINGKYGLLEHRIIKDLKITKENNIIKIFPILKTVYSSQFQGLTRALIINMITGIDDKFKKKLKISGIGFKFYFENNVLLLNIGRTQKIMVIIPFNIKIKVEANSQMTIISTSKTLVGLFAAKIRNFFPIEPYNEHGISYLTEKIIRKAGKRKIK